MASQHIQNERNNEPSMIGGHAQYAKGYVEETIGNVTGSKEWQESGKKDEKEGIETMKVCHFYCMPLCICMITYYAFEEKPRYTRY
jgi:uncharacterized protein YjbJ (UPF0337 family)